MFCMSQDLSEQEGQLYVLGLIEQLRAQCSELWGTSSDLYHRVDRLLQELSNPNLHEIFPTSAFRIEIWDRYTDHIRWVIAASASITISNAAFDAAIGEYPSQRLTLRKGAMVLREHVPKGQ
jgi:hypothetical protein